MSNNSVADLLRANLLDVFDEPDRVGSDSPQADWLNELCSGDLADAGHEVDKVVDRRSARRVSGESVA